METIKTIADALEAQARSFFSHESSGEDVANSVARLAADLRAALAKAQQDHGELPPNRELMSLLEMDANTDLHDIMAMAAMRIKRLTAELDQRAGSGAAIGAAKKEFNRQFPSPSMELPGDEYDDLEQQRRIEWNAFWAAWKIAATIPIIPAPAVSIGMVAKSSFCGNKILVATAPLDNVPLGVKLFTTPPPQPDSGRDVVLTPKQLDTLRFAAEMLDGCDCEDTAGDVRDIIAAMAAQQGEQAPVAKEQT